MYTAQAVLARASGQGLTSRSVGPSFYGILVCPLRVFSENVFVPFQGDLQSFPVRTGYKCRSYQCCAQADCPNWIWEDRVQASYSCRLRSTPWAKPSQGYAKPQKEWTSRRWNSFKSRSLTPPPGLPHVKASQSHQIAADDHGSWHRHGTPWTKL